jgi:hypothetical protein
LRVCFSWFTLKAVKNGSMTGFISNDTLTKFFWSSF